MYPRQTLALLQRRGISLKLKLNLGIYLLIDNFIVEIDRYVYKTRGRYIVR